MARKVCRNTISMSIGKSCTICFMQFSKIRFPTAGAAHAATPCCTRFPHTHRRLPSACAPLRGTNRLPHRPQTTFPEHQYRAEGRLRTLRFACRRSSSRRTASNIERGTIAS